MHVCARARTSRTHSHAIIHGATIFFSLRRIRYSQPLSSGADKPAREARGGYTVPPNLISAKDVRVPVICPPLRGHRPSSFWLLYTGYILSLSLSLACLPALACALLEERSAPHRRSLFLFPGLPSRRMPRFRANEPGEREREADASLSLMRSLSLPVFSE